MTKIDLKDLPSSRLIYRKLISGCHLNRQPGDDLWRELEERHAAYIALFDAMGLTLNVNLISGYAWLGSGRPSVRIARRVRKLSLLMLFYIEARAQERQRLDDVAEWTFTEQQLHDLMERNAVIVEAEGENPIAFVEDVLSSGLKLGFMRKDGRDGYAFLPAAGRFLEVFRDLQRLAEEEAQAAEDGAEEEAFDEDVEDEIEDLEEEGEPA